jgi:hypothetical protein
MRRRRAPARSHAFVGALALALATPAGAQQWRLHLGTGVAYNLPSSLVIEQAGAPDLTLTAEYDTRAFETPLYYVVRLERVRSDGAIGLELIHHKLFLQNRPDEVQQFAISHGFNVVTLQRAWARGDALSWRAGAGVVVAHPETEVRGRGQPRGGWLDRGYYVAGPAAQLAGSASRPLIGGLEAGLEAKLIGARAWVPVAGGSARLWHASAHLDVLLSHAF